MCTGGICMPDVDRGVLDRPARGCVDDGCAQQHRRARPAVGDVASELLACDVERAVGQLRREDARDGGGLAIARLEPHEAEGRKRGAAEPGLAGERALEHRHQIV